MGALGCGSFENPIQLTSSEKSGYAQPSPWDAACQDMSLVWLAWGRRRRGLVRDQTTLGRWGRLPWLLALLLLLQLLLALKFLE